MVLAGQRSAPWVIWSLPPFSYVKSKMVHTQGGWNPLARQPHIQRQVLCFKCASSTSVRRKGSFALFPVFILARAQLNKVTTAFSSSGQEREVVSHLP